MTQLGQWESLFPDGVSLAHYQLLCRMIRRHGPLVKIRVRPGNHEDLGKKLRRLDAK